MFIIEPFEADPDIRSPLGFLSVATTWARLLFPGITVLTRDLLHVELLHREIRRDMSNGLDEQAIRKRLRSQAVHRRLTQEFNRLRPENPSAVTKMTLWQRYASLIDYFQLWKAPRRLSRGAAHQLIFSAAQPGWSRAWFHEDRATRARRVRHVRWFSQFQSNLQTGLDGGLPAAPVRWWFFGRRVPDSTPDSIRFARSAEFAFFVWQTYFETSIQLLLRRARPAFKADRRGGEHQLLAALAAIFATQAAGGSPSNAQLSLLGGQLLWAHSQLLRRELPRWQSDVMRFPGSSPALFTLYDGSTMRQMSDVRERDLFTRLAMLHDRYCSSQNKPYARFVRVGSQARFVPEKWPAITAELSASRWGLFGYRLNEAVQLERSARL